MLYFQQYRIGCCCVRLFAEWHFHLVSLVTYLLHDNKHTPQRAWLNRKTIPVFTGSGTIALDDFTFNTVTPAVLVPAAVWLFGSGLVGLIGIAKRKKA